jgi:hypothetical protein
MRGSASALGVGLLVAVGFSTARQAAAAAPLQLGPMVVTSTASGETTLRVPCTVTPAFAIFNLDAPRRLVVDVANAQLAGAQRFTDVGSWAVSHVAAAPVDRGQSWSGVRLTIGLRHEAATRVQLDGRDLLIRVQALEPAPPAAASSGPGAAPARAPQVVAPAAPAATVPLASGSGGAAGPARVGAAGAREDAAAVALQQTQERPSGCASAWPRPRRRRLPCGTRPSSSARCNPPR